MARGDLTLAPSLFFASSQIDKRRVTRLSGGQTLFFSRDSTHTKDPFSISHQVPGLLQDFVTKTWATGGNASRFLISIKMARFNPHRKTPRCMWGSRLVCLRAGLDAAVTIESLHLSEIERRTPDIKTRESWLKYKKIVFSNFICRSGVETGSVSVITKTKYLTKRYNRCSKTTHYFRDTISMTVQSWSLVR